MAVHVLLNAVTVSARNDIKGWNAKQRGEVLPATVMDDCPVSAMVGLLAYSISAERLLTRVVLISLKGRSLDELFAYSGKKRCLTKRPTRVDEVVESI